MARTYKGLLQCLVWAAILSTSCLLPAGAAQLGSNLIGKLEGPEVVTDAAQIPKTSRRWLFLPGSCSL